MTNDERDAKIIEIISLMEQARILMSGLRAGDAFEPEMNIDLRCVSIAITELETAQLWLANARP